MLVSIIIPIYNVSEHIERCILSVLNQTYNNIEIILINDCTQDDSMEKVHYILKSRSFNYNIKTINHEINKGLSAARNTGIKASKGDYLFFLDSDDWISNDCIEKQTSIAVNGKVDMVIGNIEIVGDTERLSRWWDFSLMPNYFYDRNVIQELYYSNQLYMMAWNKLVKRKFIIDNDLYFKEGIIHEDDLWSFRIMLVINSIGILNHKTYFYYIRPNAITSNRQGHKNYSSRLIIGKKMILLTVNQNCESKKFALEFINTVFVSSIFNNIYQQMINTCRIELREFLRSKKCMRSYLKSSPLLCIPLYLPASTIAIYYKILRKINVYGIIKLPIF